MYGLTYTTPLLSLARISVRKDARHHLHTLLLTYLRSDFVICSSSRTISKFANMIVMKKASTEARTSLDDPAMVAPPGMHHNFLNPANREAAYRSIFIFCLVLSVLAVGMRMWTKTRVIRKVVLEDCKPISLSPKYLPELFETR